MILSVYTYLEQVEVVQEKNNRVPARKKVFFDYLRNYNVLLNTD